MSKLTEYAKFDKLCERDDEQMDAMRNPRNSVEPPVSQTVTKQGSEEGRYIYECNGQKVYEWSQTLEGNMSI
jgi:hypothetical protein